jgi:hypothetical protein
LRCYLSSGFQSRFRKYSRQLFGSGDSSRTCGDEYEGAPSSVNAFQEISGAELFDSRKQLKTILRLGSIVAVQLIIKLSRMDVLGGEMRVSLSAFGKAGVKSAQVCPAYKVHIFTKFLKFCY